MGEIRELIYKLRSDIASCKVIEKNEVEIDNSLETLSKLQILVCEDDRQVEDTNSSRIEITIKNCMDCPKHKVYVDPDPTDWFNDDDEKVYCIEASKCITQSCRPYIELPQPKG